MRPRQNLNIKTASGRLKNNYSLTNNAISRETVSVTYHGLKTRIQIVTANKLCVLPGLGLGLVLSQLKIIPNKSPSPVTQKVHST